MTSNKMKYDPQESSINILCYFNIYGSPYAYGWVEDISNMFGNNNMVKSKSVINYHLGVECDISSQIHSKELFTVIDYIFQLPYWI